MCDVSAKVHLENLFSPKRKGRLQRLFENPRFERLNAFLQKEPKEALATLVNRVDQLDQALQEKHPLVLNLLNRASLGTFKDGPEYARRVNEILFAYANNRYTSRKFWAQNEGINAFNMRNLEADPALVEAMSKFSKKLEDADNLLDEHIDAERLKKNVKLLVTEYNTKAAGLTTTLLLHDLDAISKAREASKFDVLPNMIDSVRASLPIKRRNDPELIKEYVFKIILNYHDDLAKYKPSDTIGEKVTIPVKRPSFMWTNWLQLSEPKATTDAFRYLLQRMETSKTELGEHFKYEPQSFRLGYYHVNGALGVVGISTQGLFRSIPFRNRIIGFVQGVLGARYKAITSDKYRVFVQKAVYQYMEAKYPMLVKKFERGTLKLEDVMGRRLPDGSYSGGPFDELLKDKKLREAIEWKMEDRLGRTQSLTSEITQERKEIELTSAILNEQLLWFHAYRTAQQHRLAATEGVMKVNQAVDARIAQKTE